MQYIFLLVSSSATIVLLLRRLFANRQALLYSINHIYQYACGTLIKLAVRFVCYSAASYQSSQCPKFGLSPFIIFGNTNVYEISVLHITKHFTLFIKLFEVIFFKRKFQRHFAG